MLDKDFFIDILRYYISEYNLPDIKFKIQAGRKSGSCAGRKIKYINSKKCILYRITLTDYWHNRYGLEAGIADLLHEIAHVIHRVEFRYPMSHDLNFRMIEIRLLKDWDLVPKDYKKAYYKRLETAAGKMIYHLA